jgi:hypothetical protein
MGCAPEARATCCLSEVGRAPEVRATCLCVSVSASLRLSAPESIFLPAPLSLCLSVPICLQELGCSCHFQRGMRSFPAHSLPRPVYRSVPFALLVLVSHLERFLIIQ